MALILIRAWRDFVPEWGGNRDLPPAEQVRLKYRTLTVEDVFRAQEEVDIDLLQAQAITQQDIRTKRKYWEFMRHVIVHHTEGWHGVKVDGQPAQTGEQVLAAVGMDSMELLGEVVSMIVGESRGTVAEAKNSDEQSVPEILESATTAESASPSNSKPLETAAEPT